MSPKLAGPATLAIAAMAACALVACCGSGGAVRGEGLPWEFA